jgi:threonine 3-dehydrogenase
MALSALPSVMRVPRFEGGGTITFAEKGVPEPGPGELLIAVKANALCGSERGQFHRGSAVTPGHEAAGIVVAAGPGASTAVGTQGVIFLMDYCGECRSCRRGFTNQCLAKRADMGFTRDGGYGPFAAISERIFFPVDAAIPLVEATLLLDVMGTSSHALRRATLVHGDIESVLIAGAGPVGLGMLVMARILFGDDLPVFIADPIPYRLELAERLGGTPIDLSRGALAEIVRGQASAGVDLAVDSSGKRAARQECLQALAKRGVMVCVGHGEDLSVSVSADLIAPERAILGSEYFCYHELPETLRHLEAHGDYVRQIITHRFPLEQLQEAFELFFAGQTGKVVIEQ